MKIKSNKLIHFKKKLKSIIFLFCLIIIPVFLNVNMFSYLNNTTDDLNNDLELLDDLKTSESLILSWWNESWNYRVRIDLITLNRTVIDVPINKRINFTDLLHSLSDYSRFDWNSIRVIEYNSSLDIWTEINCTVYEYIGATAASDYNDLTNAVVDLTWIMSGATPENDTRIYYVYFDSEANIFEFPERDYGFNQPGAYGNYGTNNLVYGDYFRIADFSASSYDLTYREGASHYGNANNPFDNVYGLDPHIAEDNEYEGKVGIFTDKNGRQAHAGSDQRWHMEYYWAGTVPSAGGPKFPIIKCAIKVDDPSTRTSLYVLTNNQWRVIFYTPDSEFTQGSYWVDSVHGSEIICDGNWHIYEYDLRWLYESYSAYYATQIEFYQSSGGTGSHYVYFDNLMCFTTDTASANDYSPTGDIVYDPPQTLIYAPELKRATLHVNAIDLNNNPVPNANITMYNGNDLIMSGLSDSNGQVTFYDVIHDDYNFTVSITSTAQGSSYTEIVNDTRTTSGEITIQYVLQTINLTCNVGTTFFNVQDADGLPVDSGWIIVGNGTNLQNCTIDENGLATFQWLNTTPYEYNYSIFYKDNDYNPSIITLESGDITIPDLNHIIYINTNLTTVNFTIFCHLPLSAIPGANLLINKTSGGQENVVQLITDTNGKATLRWLTTSSAIINGNYSIQIDFYGLKIFNTSVSWPPSVSIYEFPITSASNYEFQIETNPALYQTEIISLNPTEIISKEWGTQIRIRALFNISLYGGSTSDVNCGPAYANSMIFKIKFGSLVLYSGTMNEESGVGYYYGIIDTTYGGLECGKSYTIEISGNKKGYVLPLPITDTQLYIIQNSVQLNQSENDNSDQNVYWSEDVNMTLRAYSRIEEYFSSNISLISDDNHNFKLSIPYISNDWNLTSLKFKLSDISWTVDDSSDMGATITDPFTDSHIFNVSDGDFNFINKWWYLPTLYFNKQSPTNNNEFDFLIVGTFTTLDIVAEAIFTRDSVDIQYSIFNITDDISIQSDGEGWSIKNITFELSNCYNPTTWASITPFSAGLSFTDNNNNTLAFGSGSNSLSFSDSTIYPLNNQFLFTMQNSTPIIFDAFINIEYTQKFYINQNFEQYNIALTENDFTNGDTFTVNPSGTDWINDGVEIVFDHITNNTAPEALAMNITIDGTIYNVFNAYNQEGKYIFSLKGLGLTDSIYNVIIAANSTVNITLSLWDENHRASISSIQGTVSYEIDGTSLSGEVPYDTNNQIYILNFNSVSIDADDDAYDVLFTFTKANYATTLKDLGLKVLERKTLINSTSFILKSYQVYVGSTKLFYFNYTDTTLGTGISGSETAFCECTGNDDVFLSDLGNGLYKLDFDTEHKEIGTYSLRIKIKKSNYDYKDAYITLEIIKRKFNIETNDFIAIISGNPLYLSISLTDYENNIPINETNVYTIIDGIRYDFKDNGDGTYESDQIPTPIAFFTAQTQVITVYIEKSNYSTELITIVISVGMIEIFQGMPLFYFLMIVGALVAVVGSLGAYRYIQVKRIPKFIKKGKSIIKSISSKNKITNSMIYPSKDEFVVKMLGDRWDFYDISLSDVLGTGRDKKGKESPMINKDSEGGVE